MAKFSPKSKLPPEETELMIMGLCFAMASTKKPEEAAKILTDLLGKQELEMIAKRLKVAELILEDYNYEQIKELLKVGNSTIARVHAWLDESGEGYRLVLQRTKNQIRALSKTPDKTSSFKRKHGMYFWPEVVLNDIQNWSTKKQKQKLRKELSKVSKKKKLYKEVEKLVRTSAKFDV